MQEKNKINAEISLVNDLRYLSEAYEEISVMKMQKVRGMVLQTRDFIDGLLEVFTDLKTSYRKQIMKLMKKKGKNAQMLKNFSTIEKNGKQAILLLSSNAHLYGDIIPRVFNLFVESIKKSSSDIVIIGRLGKDLFDAKKTGRKYEYFEIPDTDVKFEDLKPLISKILNYEKVTVFYGKFENVINQQPSQKDLSGDEPLEEEKEAEEIKFLFEPSLERILNFFETQMFTSFFQQTIHESQLARYASRIRAMEEALNNIDLRLLNLRRLEKKVKNRWMNKKQTESMAGIGLWS